MKRVLAASLVMIAATAGCKSSPSGEASAGTSAGSAAATGAAASPATKGLAVGAPAPDVKLALHDGKSVQLSSLKGSPVVLYFYPKDDTPGCRIEAQGFRDNYEAVQELDVKLFGVSLQDAESHQAFIDKENLPFPLVVDDGKVADAFEVPYLGQFAKRHTILIGADGKVAKLWRSVNPSEHAAEVIAAVQALPSAKK